MDKEKKENLGTMEEIINSSDVGQIEIVYREGEAQKLLPEVAGLTVEQLSLKGNIETVHNFLSIRHNLFEADESHLCVNVSCLSISFKGNEQQAHNKQITKVKGEMERSKEFKNLPLNNNFLPKEFAKFIRRNKNMFASAEEWTNIFKGYSNFQAQINKEVESTKDQSGNFREVAAEKVAHNMIQEMNLLIPLVKGGEKLPVKVEIDIENSGGGLTCSLFAADIEEQFEAQALEILEAELEKEVDGKPMKDFCVVYYA